MGSYRPATVIPALVATRGKNQNGGVSNSPAVKKLVLKNFTGNVI